jgi:hypothetical protein
VLNGGYVGVPSSVLGEQAWPGVLSTGLGGPVSEFIEIGQFLRAVATPESGMLTAVPLRAEPERAVTLDVNAGTSPAAVNETRRAADANDGQDADEGTNRDVMATDGAATGPSNDGHRTRLFGGDSTSRSGGGAGQTTLREGIRDGVEAFREGVRNVVKTVAGRGDNHDDSTTGSAEESP